MALFDDPDHDKGEYQFFSENEYHIGIISTNATNGFIGASRSANMQLKGLNGISILDILYSDQPYLFLDSGWNLVGLPQTIDLSLYIREANKTLQIMGFLKLLIYHCLMQYGDIKIKSGM